MRIKRQRQTVWLAAVMAAILFPQGISAGVDIQVEIGDIKYELTSDNQAYVISKYYNTGINYPEDYDLVIPPTVEYEGETYTVTALKDLSIYYDSDGWVSFKALDEEPIATLSLPSTIVDLGELTDSWLERLRSITVDPENKKYRSIDGVLYSLDDDGGLDCLLIYPAKKPDTSFTVPEGVKSISDNHNYGFYEAKPITALSLPSTIYDLGNFFRYLPFLSSITVSPENRNYRSVDGVLYSLDKYGRSLSELMIYPPKKSGISFDVPEGVQTIYSGAFKGTSLTHINFPSSLRTIESDAFNGLHLDEIVLPDVVQLHGSAFRNVTCFSPVVIPESIELIGKGCFNSTTGFVDVVFPEKITEIGDSWFSNTYDETIHIQPHITKICERAFSGSDMRYIDLPDGIDTIEDGAFSHCDSLTEVKLPLDLYELDRRLFLGCDNLRAVTINKNVEMIYMDVFEDCPSLSDIYIFCETPPEFDIFWGTFAYDRLGKITVHVMPGCGEAYRNHYRWKEVGPIVEDLTEDGVDEMPDDGQIASDERCRVYTVQGTIAADAIAYGELRMALPSGIYIIRTASGKTEKISI